MPVIASIAMRCWCEPLITSPGCSKCSTPRIRRPAIKFLRQTHSWLRSIGAQLHSVSEIRVADTCLMHALVAAWRMSMCVHVFTWHVVVWRELLSPHGPAGSLLTGAKSELGAMRPQSRSMRSLMQQRNSAIESVLLPGSRMSPVQCSGAPPWRSQSWMELPSFFDSGRVKVGYGTCRALDVSSGTLAREQLTSRTLPKINFNPHVLPFPYQRPGHAGDDHCSYRDCMQMRPTRLLRLPPFPP